MTGRPRVLVLGATGMLGHRLWRECAARFDARATIREPAIPPAAAGVLDPDRTLTGVQAEDERALADALDRAAPDAVVNCIGVVKQRPEAAAAATLMYANALFPHRLEAACETRGTRLIHISTDCVFSGGRGAYTEADLPDPVDLYGRSKLAGEPQGERTLTLRTSMLGSELARASGLLEWFLAQREPVKGYSRAIFSGPTTPVLARLIADIVSDEPELAGTWHVGAAAISKLEVLELLREAFAHELEIEADDGVQIDRSLDSARLRERLSWHPPSWGAMITELADEVQHAR